MSFTAQLNVIFLAWKLQQDSCNQRTQKASLFGKITHVVVVFFCFYANDSSFLKYSQQFMNSPV